MKALTDQQKEKLEKYSAPCRQESGITQEEVNKVDVANFPDDAKTKKHVLCVLKKLEFIDDNGDLKIEKIKPTVVAASEGEEQSEKIVAKCAVKKDTAEDTAFQLVDCLHKQLPNYAPVV